MEEPTFPYAVAKSAGVPSTRSRPCCRRLLPRGRVASGGAAVSAAPLVTSERYRRGRLGMDRHDQRDDENGDDVGNLDHWVDRRPGRVLVGIPDRVAGDRCRMRL